MATFQPLLWLVLPRDSLPVRGHNHGFCISHERNSPDPWLLRVVKLLVLHNLEDSPSAAFISSSNHLSFLHLTFKGHGITWLRVKLGKMALRSQETFTPSSSYTLLLNSPFNHLLFPPLPPLATFSLLVPPLLDLIGADSVPVIY